MPAKNMPPSLKSSKSLEEIREIILGEPFQELQRQIARLSQKVEALASQPAPQRNYDRRLRRMRAQLDGRMDEYVRRAAVHKAKTTLKVKKLAAEIQRVAKRVKSDRRRRAALGEAMAKLADQLNASVSARADSGNNKPTNRQPRHGSHRAPAANDHLHSQRSRGIKNR